MVISGGGGLDSLKSSFTRPYSPPPRPVTALHLNGGKIGGGDGSEDVQMISARSLDGGMPMRSSGSFPRGDSVETASQPSSKVLTVAMVSGNIEGTPTKSPAFLQQPPMVTPSAEDISNDVTVLNTVTGDGLDATGGNDGVEMGPGGRAVMSPMAASLPRRLTNPAAHDSATSSEVVRRSSSQNSKNSCTNTSVRQQVLPPAIAGMNAPSLPASLAVAVSPPPSSPPQATDGPSTVPAPPSRAESSGGFGTADPVQEVTDLLPLLPTEKLQLPAAGEEIAVTAAHGGGGLPVSGSSGSGGGGNVISAAAAEPLKRIMPHLSLEVIQSAEEAHMPGPEVKGGHLAVNVRDVYPASAAAPV